MRAPLLPLLSGLAGAATAATPPAPPVDAACNHHGDPPSGGWLQSRELRQRAAAKQRVPVTPPRARVDLDLPPRDRWAAAIAARPWGAASPAKLFKDYLDSMLPPLVVGLLEDAIAPLVRYHGFGDDYTAEMEGLAEGLNMSTGEVVLINLIYQFEHLGVNCSNWNDTGATGECKDGVAFPFRSKLGGGRTGPPGQCTSIIAEREDGSVLHARNFDWNLPNALRPLIWEIDFVRGGEVSFTATSVVGFVGVQNAMRRGAGAWALTMDARCQGGVLLGNLAAMLLDGARTPAQHARRVMETAAGYDDAVAQLSSAPLVDQMYYIVSGAAAGQGAVIARERASALDVWRLNDSEVDGWFRLQTNYDRWAAPPVADDRRTPGEAHLRTLTRKQLSVSGLYGVMLQWPTFNYHTDHTAVFVVSDGTYNTTVWMGDDPSTGPPVSAVQKTGCMNVTFGSCLNEDCCAGLCCERSNICSPCSGRAAAA